jgi:uncharacterized membrane protein YtjA (UPF0391 family)
VPPRDQAANSTPSANGTPVAGDDRRAEGSSAGRGARSELQGRAGDFVAKGAARSGPLETNRSRTMLKWALIFFVISIVAGLLGFTGIAAGAAGIAKFLFWVFVVLFLIFLIAGYWAGRKIL